VAVDYRDDRVACWYLDYTWCPLGNTSVAQLPGRRRIIENNA